MSDNAQELKTLEAKLNSLRSELDQQILAVQKRTRTMIIVFGVLFVAMCFYLSVAYNRIAGFDAPIVMSLAEKELLKYVDDELTSQIGDLKSSAPRHIKLVEEQLLDTPEKISKQLQTVVVEKLAEHLPKLESELNDKIGAAIIVAKTQAQEQKLDLSKQEDFKKFVDMVTVSAFGEMGKVVDKVQGEYLQISGRAADYLELLAHGEKLDKRQQLQRSLFITFLMLQQKGIDPTDPSSKVTIIPEEKK